jgi:FKBP-type peptidyl-prolyl cis-trans isomerase (trigger factor)
MTGMSMEQAEKELLDKDDELRVEAMNDLRRFFILDAVAKKEKIDVKDGELKEAMHRIAVNSGHSIEDIQAQIGKDKSQLGELRWRLIEEKVAARLIEDATVSDKS